MQVVHDAIDRMVMQSDLRDIYHGVHVAGFSNITSRPNNKTQAATAKIANETNVIGTPLKGIDTEFHLQLSDNSKNEEQIMDVFKTYLQKNNFNLGGTNLYSSQSLVEHIRANGEFFSLFLHPFLFLKSTFATETVCFISMVGLIRF